MVEITRLYYEAVKDIPSTLNELDQYYLEACGLDLRGIACRTANIAVSDAVERIKGRTAAVVPISSGQGVIPGFSEAVKAILNHIGIESFVTGKTDIGGIGEAFISRADLLFSADDDNFLAVNLRTSTVTDNSRATAIGFVHALAAAAEKTAGGLAGEKSLVIGLGPVGTHAASELLRIGAGVIVYDIDPARVKQFTDRFHGVIAAESLIEAANEADFILDATPSAGIIDAELIRERTVIACPGVPHGLTPAAFEKIGHRFIHDVLPLGVATMAMASLKPGD